MMFFAFGAKCGARAASDPSPCCANSGRSISDDSARPPIPNPDCRKKCRRVIVRSVLGSIEVSFLAERLVEVQQCVRDERPRRLLRRIDAVHRPALDGLRRRGGILSEPLQLLL